MLCALSLAFYRQIALTNLILSGADATTYFYPYRAYAAQAIRNGRIPLWNPYLFLGVPFLANPQAGVFYPLNLALCWLPAPKLVAWSIVLHVAMAAVFAYLYARRVLHLSPLPALLGASAFALGGFLSGQVEHVNQLNVSAWFPLLLLLWEGRQRARWPTLLGLGMVIGVGLLAGHAQSSYISLVGLCVYALLLPLSPRRRGDSSLRTLPVSLAHLWKTAWRLGFVVLVGLGLAAVQLLPTLELSQLSIRSGGLSYREAVAFSLRPLPRFLRYTFLPPWGRNLSEVFGGDFFTEYLAYVGVVPLLLALWALVLWLLRATGFGHISLYERWPRASLKMAALAGLGVFLALGLFNPLYLVLFKIVPGFDLFRAPARWLFLYAFGAAMLAGIGLQQVYHWLRSCLQGGWAVTLLLLAIGLIELFAAARALPLSHPTAPEAFSSLRTAPAHILAAQRQEVAPGRFLSVSDILFDPGDLGEIQQIFQGQLSEKAIYDYVVNVKRQEVLVPNLPLAWQIYAVDGYDGGVLPLARYVHLQQLFLEKSAILPDGRLREGLKRIPPSRLLSILGVHYVITDKVHDVWIDDVFYDLTFDTVLGADAPQTRLGLCPDVARSVTSQDLPRFVATSLGIVSYLEGAQAVEGGTPVAEVRLATESGETQTFVLRAGQETAEGIYQGNVAHTRARVGRRWRADEVESEEAAEGNDYVAQLSWGTPLQIAQVEIVALPFGGRIHIHGLALIDARDGSNMPLILSNEGYFRQVHSGDVKVYGVMDALPRAHVVHRTRLIADDERAIATMAEPAFDPARTAILASGREIDETLSDAAASPAAGPTPPAPQVIVTAYKPEQIVLQTSLQAPGYVVLSDSWYPGWRASIDGGATSVERANVAFRAVYVPEGTHTVCLTYRPKSYLAGLGISVMTFFGVAVWLASGWSGSGHGCANDDSESH